MSNQYQGLTSGLAQLKNYYQGPLVDLMSEEIPVYRACEKVKKGWSGLQIIRALRTVRNQGVGAIADGGVLPKIGRQTSNTVTIPAKFNYLRFGVTGPMIKASQSDVGSFVRSAAYELEMGYKDLKTEINRQLCWTGRGDLAVVNTAAAASSSLVIQGRTTGEAALKYVDVGTTFDIINTSSTVLVTQVTVTAITTGTASSATATITLDQPITAAVANILVRSGSSGNEIQGLFYALDGGTTSVYSLDRSTNLAYQGNYYDFSTLQNAQLSIDGLQNPFNEGLRRGNVGAYNAAYCDFTSLRYYQKLLAPDKRYSSVQGDGTFGSKGKFFLDFNGIAMVPDKDMPLRIAMLPAEVLTMYELAAMEFADETGSMYIAATENDQLEVRIRHFVNLFNEQPAACAVAVGYTSP